MRTYAQLEDGEGVKIHHGGGNGQEGGVETVEQSAVAGEEVAAVLESELALDEAFDEVAPGTENDYDEGETEPLRQGEAGVVAGDEPCCQKTDKGSTDTALPSLTRGDAGKEFVAAQQGAEAVGSGVAGPEEDKDGEGEYPPESDLLGMGWVSHKGQCRYECKGQCHVHLTEHRIGPVVEGTFTFQVELGDEKIDYADEVGDEDGRCRCPSAAVAEKGQEEVGTGYGGYHGIDIYVAAVVDERAKLADAECRDKGEKDCE